MQFKLLISAALLSNSSQVFAALSVDNLVGGIDEVTVGSASSQVMAESMGLPGNAGSLTVRNHNFPSQILRWEPGEAKLLSPNKNRLLSSALVTSWIRSRRKSTRWTGWKGRSAWRG